MKKFVISLLFSILIINAAFSNEVKKIFDQKVYFKGSISDALGGKVLRFNFYKDYFNGDWVKDIDELKFSTNDKDIKFSMPLKADYGYFRIGIPSSKISSPSFNARFSLYLIRPNDNITFTIEDKSIKFTGQGAVRLNCQREMFDNCYTISQREIDLINKNLMTEYYLLKYRRFDSCMTEQLRVLNKYKQQLTKEDFNIIKTNFVSSNGLLQLFDLKEAFQKFGPGYEEFSINKNRFIQEFGKKQLSVLDESLIKSSSYAQFIYQKELCNQLLKTSVEKEGNVNMLKSVYANINKGYQGVFRDKLMAYFFIKALDERSFPFEQYLSDGLKFVTSSEYRSILEDLKNAKFTGMEAFNFSFRDTLDNMVSLNNFKGKVVVMDFWFTGCLPCMTLARNMHFVTNKFKGRDSVVFLSVCTDIEKEKWKRSVVGGKYTNSQTINVYTNGMGMEHPMIKYYNYNGCPQLLIIDADGKILSSNPPRPKSVISINDFKRKANGDYLAPDEDEALSAETKSFIGLIESGLKRSNK
jgi:thiol-disulfide isomerase/thioredoxin